MRIVSSVSGDFVSAGMPAAMNCATRAGSAKVAWKKSRGRSAYPSDFKSSRAALASAVPASTSLKATRRARRRPSRIISRPSVSSVARPERRPATSAPPSGSNRKSSSQSLPPPAPRPGPIKNQFEARPAFR